MTRKKRIQSSKAHSKTAQREPVKPLIAGIVGAAVGAGVGYAGVIAMRDQKTKAKMIDVMNLVAKKAGEYFENMKKEAAAQLTDKAGETFPEVRKIAAGNR